MELEATVDESRIALQGRRRILDRIDTITTYAREMREFLGTSELTESKAFVHSFVKNIAVKGSEAVISYTVPMPEDSPIGRSALGEIDLDAAFRNTDRSGTPAGTVLRTFLLAVELKSAVSGGRQD